MQICLENIMNHTPIFLLVTEVCLHDALYIQYIQQIYTLKELVNVNMKIN